MKGLHCSIYACKAYGDCSNGGISATHKSVILCGAGVPEIFDATPNAPAVILRARGDYLYAVPEARPRDMAGPMFGGAFIYTSDSRFPSMQPIALHDRFEQATEAQAQ